MGSGKIGRVSEFGRRKKRKVHSKILKVTVTRKSCKNFCSIAKHFAMEIPQRSGNCQALST